jgi:hypothetical protein
LNRGLLVFGLFLVLIGIGLNFYLLSFFGILIIIPALISRPRLPVPPNQTGTTQQPRRVGSVKPQPMPAPSQPMGQPTSQAYQPVQSQFGSMALASTSPPMQPSSYSPSLFPTSMFPSLNLYVNTAQPAPEAARKPSERDELIEVGAVVALLRLLLG